MSIIDDTLAELEKARSISKSALIAFSGGKDSLTVMDLALRVFDHVEGFFMYLVPGMECVEKPLVEAASRFGVKVHLYPHFTIADFLRDGVYCEIYGRDIPGFKLADVYALAMAETKIPLVLTGQKKADSSFRRRLMQFDEKRRQRSNTVATVINPIAEWRKHDVVGYLHFRGIPLPPSRQAGSNGVGLDDCSVLWLYDEFPEDYKRLKAVFPYVEVIPKRREFYGNGTRTSQQTPKVEAKDRVTQ